MNHIAALIAENSSTRLNAALSIGINPEPGMVDAIVARFGVEPDFYVRDMLTWALTRFPIDITVPKLVAELQSENAQVRSQALHALSKIKDSGAWPAITRSLLHDANVEVAQSAWRAAVALVPEEQKRNLAEELTVQLGRGDRDVQLSLSRALIALGEEIVQAVLEKAMLSDIPNVRAHACATERLMRDPDSIVAREAKRVFLLSKK